MDSSVNIRVRSNVSSPVISVIIPFYGEKNDLFKCLGGLKKQNFIFEYEIIVVESHSDPATVELIKFSDKTTLISSDSLMYPGKARNLGIASSTADLLAFIDADCVPELNWLPEIYSSLKRGYDIVIGPVLNLYPLHPIASVDNLFLFTDFQKHPSLKNFHHFPGSNFGITKELFYKAGKFPEDIQLAEDTLFSESALRKGKILFNKNVIVRHSGRKNFAGFKKHLESFGFYKGYLNLRSAPQNKLRRNYFFPVLLGLKRLAYITIRTLQWNPPGLFRIIFFFPFLMFGISAWITGFRKGNRKFLSETGSGNSEIFLKDSGQGQA